MIENLIFIQAVPKDNYFVWQLEVQITNFREFGVSSQMEIIVWYPKGFTDFAKWKELEAKYPEVKLFYYEDSGVDLALYIPQLRPHSLKKHFSTHSDRLKDKVFFYHDADILFRELPNFEKLLADDICWQSDCSSYLDYSYFKSKEIQGNIPQNELINVVCAIGNISHDLYKSYDRKTGGAQYILKGIDSFFWQDVEDMCTHLRNNLMWGKPDSINTKYFPNEDAGVQSWCADMWAVNMSLWKRGLKTDITTLLDFSWATDSANTYHKKPIYHNAGALPRHGFFRKTDWIDKWPLGKVHTAPETSANWFYVQALNKVK